MIDLFRKAFREEDRATKMTAVASLAASAVLAVLLLAAGGSR